MQEEYLLATCSQCGKKYGVAAAHFNRSTPRPLRLVCNACGSPVQVAGQDTIRSARREVSQSEISLPAVPALPAKNRKEDVSQPAPSEGQHHRRFGLTQKFLVFTLAPLLIISFLSISFSIDKMLAFQKDTLSGTLTIVNGLSEELLRQISTTVARQTRQYLFSHPDLKKQDFNRDIYFKKIVLQNIGETGTVSLYEVGGKEAGWRTWVDVDPKIVGKDLKEIERVIEEDFSRFWKIVSGIQSGAPSSGYCRWVDDKGRLRDRYIVCTPVEGTPYGIATSIYVDEFILPLKKIEAQGKLAAREMRNTNIFILGGGLILIAAILFFYGRNLTGKILSISQRADRISLGELDLEQVLLRSNDEIQDLDEAISRMQQSILLAVKRMRKRG